VKLQQRRDQLLKMGTQTPTFCLLTVCCVLCVLLGSGWGAKRVDNLIAEIASAHAAATPAKVLVRFVASQADRMLFR
jgi:hypothetical protein